MRTWSDKECANAVKNYLNYCQETGEAPRKLGYMRWHKKNKGTPCVSALYRVSSWKAIAEKQDTSNIYPQLRRRRWNQDKCVAAIRQFMSESEANAAQQDLDHYEQWHEIHISPSIATIYSVLGSWNKAKQIAQHGLK